jgi:hypothetical protein
MSAVYQINKGINRAIEFRGIKAQYIIYSGVGLVLLLLVFAISYMLGCNAYLLLGFILPAGGGLVMVMGRLSHRYGEHGLLKKIASKQLPKCVRSKTSKLFFLSGK